MSKIWTDYFKPGKILLLIVGMLAAVIGIQLFVVIRVLGFTTDGKLVQVTVEGVLLVGSYIITALAMLLLISEYFRVKSKIAFYEKIVGTLGVPAYGAVEKAPAEMTVASGTPEAPIDWKKDPVGFLKSRMKSEPGEGKGILSIFNKKKAPEPPKEAPSDSFLDRLKARFPRRGKAKPESGEEKPKILDDPIKESEAPKKPSLIDQLKAKVKGKEKEPSPKIEEPKKESSISALKGKLTQLFKKKPEEKPERKLLDEPAPLEIKHIKLDDAQPQPATESPVPAIKEKRSSVADLLAVQETAPAPVALESKPALGGASFIKTEKTGRIDELMKTAAETVLRGDAPIKVAPLRATPIQPKSPEAPLPSINLVPAVDKGEPIKTKPVKDEGKIPMDAGASETLSMDNLLDFSKRPQAKDDSLQKYKTMSIKVEETAPMGPLGEKPLTLDSPKIPEPASKSKSAVPAPAVDAEVDPKIIQDSEFLKVLKELDSVVGEMKSRRKK